MPVKSEEESYVPTLRSSRAAYAMIESTDYVLDGQTRLDSLRTAVNSLTSTAIYRARLTLPRLQISIELR